MNEFCFHLKLDGWKPEVWAAWAQFAAACIVGFFAIWVPARIAKNAEKRQSRNEWLRARSFVLAREQDLEDVFDNLLENEHTNPRGEPIKDHNKWVRCFEIPASIELSFGSLHEAGPAAEHLQSAFSELVDVRDYWNHHRAVLAGRGADAMELDTNANVRMHNVLKNMRLALVEVDRLLGRENHLHNPGR